MRDIFSPLFVYLPSQEVHHALLLSAIASSLPVMPLPLLYAQNEQP